MRKWKLNSELNNLLNVIFKHFVMFILFRITLDSICFVSKMINCQHILIKLFSLVYFYYYLKVIFIAIILESNIVSKRRGMRFKINFHINHEA